MFEVIIIRLIDRELDLGENSETRLVYKIPRSKEVTTEVDALLRARKDFKENFSKDTMTAIKVRNLKYHKGA